MYTFPDGVFTDVTRNSCIHNPRGSPQNACHTLPRSYLEICKQSTFVQLFLAFETMRSYPFKHGNNEWRLCFSKRVVVGVLHVMDATPGLLCQVTIRKLHGKTRIASLMYCFRRTHTICCLVPLVSLRSMVDLQ